MKKHEKEEPKKKKHKKPTHSKVKHSAKVKPHKKKKASSKGKSKVEKVMHEFKEGKLHSGTKKGPQVTNPKQAIAIGISEARKAGAKIPKKRK